MVGFIMREQVACTFGRTRTPPQDADEQRPYYGTECRIIEALSYKTNRYIPILPVLRDALDF